MSDRDVICSCGHARSQHSMNGCTWQGTQRQEQVPVPHQLHGTRPDTTAEAEVTWLSCSSPSNGWYGRCPSPTSGWRYR